MDVYNILINGLPRYMQDGQNIQRVYKVLADILGDILTFYEEIQLCRDIDQSKNIGLDNIGSKLGEDRLGRDDSSYRMALKTKVISNRSDGDIETLNDYGRALFGQFFAGIIEGETSGKITLRYNFTELEDPIGMFKKAVAGGIKVDTQYQTWIPVCGTFGIGTLPLVKRLTNI